ncbi:MAG TPA: urease accessory protein UreE [Phnomibacter sp.]|nr:urease accessory protein UreE [Phnomibacter sp.]
MMIKEKIGNVNSFPVENRTIDYLLLDWFETGKRILHKKTTSGQEVVMKFLGENQQLTQGDILFADDSRLIVVAIKPCDALVIKPRSTFEVASLCYEIGNKHLPLFYQDNDLLVAYDAPLYRLLVSSGYELNRQEATLLNPLKTTVSPHGNGGQDSLFSKIMKLTSAD